MQDRFKFRVWDKEQNKYLPLVSRSKDLDLWISLDNTGVYLIERDNNRDVAYFNDITNDVIIQQCTGLKDKNGTLIYDGDFVKDVSTSTLYKVGFKKGAFYLENKEFIGYFHELSLSFAERRLEVIGNIYEK